MGIVKLPWQELLGLRKDSPLENLPRAIKRAFATRWDAEKATKRAAEKRQQFETVGTKAKDRKAGH